MVNRNRPARNSQNAVLSLAVGTMEAMDEKEGF
jgi:hypothetical protein